MAFLKTPYGMMFGFMAFTLIVLPMLKVDPEEYKAMKQETKQLKQMLSGGGGGGGGGGASSSSRGGAVTAGGGQSGASSRRRH